MYSEDSAANAPASPSYVTTTSSAALWPGGASPFQNLKTRSTSNFDGLVSQEAFEPNRELQE